MSIHSAAMAGDPVAVRAALAAGADACELDDYDNSVLHLLAAYGHGRGDRWDFVAEQDTLGANLAPRLTETAALLLAAGAATLLEAENSYEKTAVAEACVHGNLTMASFLITAGASTDAVDTDGWPLLHAAAKHGHPDVCRLLLQHGADVNALHCGLSALHSAASSVWRVRAGEVARVLIEAGVAVQLVDDEGKTAADRAAATGWPEAEQGCFQTRRVIENVEGNQE
jgi:ankyrin repeat protein